MVTHRPRRNSGKLIVKLALLLVLIGIGAGGGFFLAKKRLSAAPATDPAAAAAATQATQNGQQPATEGGEAGKDGAAPELEVYELGQFLVNVEGGGGLHFLRTEVALEVEPQPGKDGKRKEKKEEGEGKAEKAKLPSADEARAKDIVVKALSSSRFESLRTPEGKEKLRARLLETLKEKLPQQKTRSILFVSFVMQ